MEARLNSALEMAVKEKKLAAVGAIALDKDGKEIYKGAFGTINLNDPNAEPFTASMPYMAWSTTKLVTSVAALQLIERGKLKIDDPVEKYIPSISENKVLTGWNEDGTPQLRAPKNKVTILNLLTHTGGFVYDFLNGNNLRYKLFKNIDPAIHNIGNPVQYLDSPFAFEPGTAHEYGINLDILGLVIEAISGQKLPEYFKEHIFKPLGMKDTAAQPELGSKGVETNLIVHHRGADGSLTANPALQFPKDPEIHGGGHFLYTTLDDYASKFLVTILNGGAHPLSGARILQQATVDGYLFQEKIESAVGAPATGAGVLAAAIPAVSNDGEVLPGLKKSWSCGLLLNLEASPVGRSAGSGAWCGLGNIYYWIDRTAGKTGLLATEVLPFFDEEALALFDEFERAVYGHPSAKEGERRNYVTKPAAVGQ